MGIDWGWRSGDRIRENKRPARWSASKFCPSTLLPPLHLLSWPSILHFSSTMATRVLSCCAGRVQNGAERRNSCLEYADTPAACGLYKSGFDSWVMYQQLRIGGWVTIFDPHGMPSSPSADCSGKSCAA